MCQQQHFFLCHVLFLMIGFDTLFKVTFPLLEPRKSFVLVSCHLNIIAKYAEELGFEKKLVLTVDR